MIRVKSKTIVFLVSIWFIFNYLKCTNSSQCIPLKKLRAWWQIKEGKKFLNSYRKRCQEYFVVCPGSLGRLIHPNHGFTSWNFNQLCCHFHHDYQLLHFKCAKCKFWKDFSPSVFQIPFQEQGNEKTNNGTHYKLQLLYSNGECPSLAPLGCAAGQGYLEVLWFPKGAEIPLHEAPSAQGWALGFSRAWDTELPGVPRGLCGAGCVCAAALGALPVLCDLPRSPSLQVSGQNRISMWGSLILSPSRWAGLICAMLSCPHLSCLLIIPVCSSFLFAQHFLACFSFSASFWSLAQLYCRPILERNWKLCS